MPEKHERTVWASRHGQWVLDQSPSGECGIYVTGNAPRWTGEERPWPEWGKSGPREPFLIVAEERFEAIFGFQPAPGTSVKLRITAAVMETVKAEEGM